jgi:hypothetical protein
MIEKINKRLNEYLGFDNNELYIDPLVRVFGGAIRDSIANQEIHDVDILCGSNSIKLVQQVLIKNGYKFIPKLSTIDIVTLYSNINVISEPKTFIKGDSIVQLIRPRLIINVLKEDGTSNFGLYEDKYIENFKELIKNVDLSCCGISFSNNILYQNCENAIIHCLNKVFVVNNSARMYSYERCTNRTHKMMERGWEKVVLNTTEKRDLKLDFLLNPISFEFTNEF